VTKMRVEFYYHDNTFVDLCDVTFVPRVGEEVVSKGKRLRVDAVHHLLTSETHPPQKVWILCTQIPLHDPPIFWEDE